jgi:ATP-binding cassette, subfamily B (MDR/TAP), member 1
MWGMGLMFWWGGWLLVEYPDSFTYRDFLISMFSLLFSLTGLSIAAEGAVDRTKAKKAAARIFELTDRQSLIDPLITEGRLDIEFDSVTSANSGSHCSFERKYL